MIVAAGVDWTSVLVALIGGLPAILATIFAYLIHRAIRTPSGMSIGKQVEASHHVAIGNAYRLHALQGEEPAAATSQAAVYDHAADAIEHEAFKPLPANGH